MKSLHLALVQSNTVWHNPITNQQQCEALLETVPTKTNLIVLPEMWATGFTMSPNEVSESMRGASVQWMQHIAKTHQAAVCGSLAIKEAGNFYNRFVFAHPNGSVDTYDKVHPFTFSGEDDVYTAGKGSVLIEYLGFRIRPLVCYDLRFPVFARNNDAYDLLICVANWPSVRIQAWNALLRARAIENMAYSIGVNRIGNDEYGLEYPGASAGYNALGDALVLMDKNTSVATASLSLEELYALRKKLPFLEDRDDFTLT